MTSSSYYVQYAMYAAYNLENYISERVSSNIVSRFITTNWRVSAIWNNIVFIAFFVLS